MSIRRNLVMLGLIALLSGCHSSSQPVVVLSASPASLAPAPRTLQWPDYSLLPKNPGQLPPVSGSTNQPYFYLTAEDCRSRACSQAQLANLLLQASQSPQRGHSTPARDQVEMLRTQTANHLSRDIRNRTAGAALELYYRLLEAELLTEVLDASQSEVASLLEIQAKLTARGAKEAQETDQLRKRQIELQSEKAKLQSGIQRLNTELKLLIKQEQLQGNLLPADGIQIPAGALEIDGLIQVALNHRPDLHVLRELIARVSPETVGPIKQALAQLIPPLGAIQVTARTLLPGLATLIPALQASTDVASLRQQLRDALKFREDEARIAIRRAAEEWESQRLLVAIARHQVEFEASNVQELEVQKAAGKSVELELRQARLARLKAEGELVRESLKWKQADVKTRLEMGILCPLDSCCNP